MKTKVDEVAKKISLLSSNELDELATILLNKHDINATFYRLNPNADIPTTCNLALLETGSAKLMLVKTIKESFGLGLKEAKDLMDNAPCYLKENMDIDDAEKIKESLEEVGAKIEIVYHYN